MLTGISLFPCARRTLFLAALFACLCPAAQALRKDIVVMKNGDHLTGQVKRLENGLLYVETEYASGNLALDWNQVKSIQSTATYRIVLNNGHRLNGKIEKHSAEEVQGPDFLIHEATEEVQIAATDIVASIPKAYLLATTAGP